LGGVDEFGEGATEGNNQVDESCEGNEEKYLGKGGGFGV